MPLSISLLTFSAITSGFTIDIYNNSGTLYEFYIYSYDGESCENGERILAGASSKVSENKKFPTYCVSFNRTGTEIRGTIYGVFTQACNFVISRSGKEINLTEGCVCAPGRYSCPETYFDLSDLMETVIDNTNPDEDYYVRMVDDQGQELTNSTYNHDDSTKSKIFYFFKGERLQLEVTQGLKTRSYNLDLSDEAGSCKVNVFNTETVSSEGACSINPR